MTAAKMQAHRATDKRLSSAARWRRANAIVDRSKLLPTVEHTLHATTGRPRQFTARALMVCLLMHAFDGQSMVLTEVIETASHLTPSQRWEVGMPGVREVTYPMLSEAFAKLTRVFKKGGLPIPEGDAVLTAQVFADHLIAASVPATYTPPSCYALDGTDFETHARRRSWGDKESLSDAGTEIPAGTLIAPPNPHNEDKWPRRGDGDRPQHSMDTDARDGFRSGHNGRGYDIYVGYELHLATPIREVGSDDDIPHLVMAMTVTPGGSKRGGAGVRTIDALIATGREVTEVCADRGYTYCLPETFVLPLWQRSVDVWADFHPNQRGDHPGPIPGTIWIDGAIYPQCIPKVMRKIAPPPKFPKLEQTAAARAAFDLRKAYAFTALTKRDKAGYQRLKGPARAGHVRCPNFPKSMRLSYDHPTTTCVIGEPCACDKTVTISPDMYPRERQTHAWGTTDWATAYYRRSAIESTNAELKVHRMKLERGYTRVFGLIKNTLLLAFGIAGSNVMQLRTWHAVRCIPDPWAVALGEDDLGDGAGIYTVTGRARRRARRKHGYADIGVAPPPDDPPADSGGTYTEVTA